MPLPILATTAFTAVVAKHHQKMSNIIMAYFIHARPQAFAFTTLARLDDRDTSILTTADHAKAMARAPSWRRTPTGPTHAYPVDLFG